MELVASAGDYACHKEGLLGRWTSWQCIFNSRERNWKWAWHSVHWCLFTCGLSRAKYSSNINYEHQHSL